jgi:acetylornithine deacetylase/succinyl-diaminopimelate desuccinylase-like protein
MYDVQPVDEPNWTSPPFAAEVRELPGLGPCVVARGAANSKGCLAALFVAVEVLNELHAMPVTLTLLIEGEEELGSPHLPAVVEAHRDQLAATAAFDLDLTAGVDGVPELITGCKGLLSLELVAEAGAWGGPALPLHSSEEAWISSPAWALVHALASLTERDETIAVAGLRAPVRGPDEDDQLAIKRLASTFDPAAHLREVHAARYRLPGPPEDLLRALMFEPTVNIDGLTAGYTGPGGKTIIPSVARAVLDVRLVPDMDAAATAQAVREHLADLGLGHVEVRELESYPWAKASPGNPAAAAMEASYRAMGLAWLPYPMAPWCAPYFVFDRILGLPWASGGVGHAGGAHGPDEYATVEGLKQHIVGVAAYLLAWAEER